MGKVDSTGTYAYVCDGASPGSPVLSDGHTTYTPGLSENTGGTSRYYSFDRIGNLWTVDGASKSQLFYEDNTGFGSLFAQLGSTTPFGFGGGNGCQTDVDTGLVLMGHRYYDTRIGRFISQDPAGDGNNWYAYAGNNPTNEVDPSSLSVGEDGYTDPDGYHEIPGTSWNDGNGHSGASYAPNSSTSTDAVTSSGELVSGGSVGMFHQHDGEPLNAADLMLINLATAMLTGGHEETPFYRGGTDFTASKGEVKMIGNKVQPMKRGISLFSNKAKIPKRFVPNRVTNIPDELVIRQRGQDPEHYEVLTKEEMEFER